MTARRTTGHATPGPDRTDEPWSYSIGDHGATVRVYERTPGGVLYIAAWDPTLNHGRGGPKRRSLKHRDRAAAKREARRVAAALESSGDLVLNPTLGYLIDGYRRTQVTRMKHGTTKWIETALDCWLGFLGQGYALRELGPEEWERFKQERRSGRIDAAGRPVTDRAALKPVMAGTVNLGLDAMNMLCNWAMRTKVSGRRLLDRSPCWKLPYAKDVNPRRSIWTEERLQQVLARAEEHQMQVEWSGRRRHRRSHLADILFIMDQTGRRLGAVRQLRPTDIKLDQGTHGKIEWPSETDKAGKRWLTAIRPELRPRLERILRQRQAIGTGPLFPAPRNQDEAVCEGTVADWLHQVLKELGLPRLPHDRFHGIRRKWVTERKHLPDVDVARAGGWRSVQTMKRAYQQADDAGVLEAVLERRTLHERTS